MPRYDFRAVDASGQRQTGSLDASSANDLVRSLAGRGLRVEHVTPSPGTVAQVSSVPKVFAQASNAGYSPALAPAPQQVQARPVAATTQAAPNYDPVCRVASSSDGDLYFLFAQMSNLFRAGLTPVQVMQDLGAKQRKRGWSQAFTHIAELASRGVPLSVGMEIYEPIFTKGGAGAVAAGEFGGYLWQACEQVAESAKSMRRVRLLYNWVSFIAWSSIISAPLLGVGAAGIDRTIAAINESVRTPAGMLQIMGEAMVKALLGPYGLGCLLLLVLYIWLRWAQKQSFSRPLRSQLCANLPLIGKKTKAENAAVFAYHLEMLQNAGISPQRSWNLAAKAIPNETLAEGLSQSSLPMTEASRLSEGFARTRLFPEEMGHLIQTGEMTGSVGRALEDARQMSMGQAKNYQAVLVVKGAVWIALILFASAALSFGYLYKSYTDSAFTHILEDK